MRKFSLLAAAAVICISAPVLAKGGNNNGNGGGGTAGQGSGGSNGNSGGQGNGGGQGAGNGQNNGNGNGQGSGGSQGAGNGQSGGNGQGAGSGNSGNGGGAGNGGNGQGSGQGTGSGSGGNGGGSGLGGGQSQGNSGGLGGGNGGANSQPVACGLNDLSITALSCSGFYSGNLLSDKGVAAQVAGLALVGFSWDGDFNALVNAGQKIDGNGATEIGFGKELIGLTVIGIHFGGGGPDGVGNGTAFYSFDAGSGVNTLGLNYPGSSGIMLYSTGHPVVPNPPVPPENNTGSVPEPSSWALMIGGFGMVGYAMRRRKGVVATA